ncbi:MAG TPA: cbb3-type cytochrome oxidase assembly protein CcoS [Paracoccaceae bacterium]|jgi:cbb3-type cytochrome oxidase maturation protein|nr:cbb3-type cytochrome oxidase assembly protein CcoS [Paracoccaceae bacterium]
MEVLAILIPVSIGLGIVGLLAFFWTMKNRQYEDPQGDAERILRKDYDDEPAEDRKRR